ncbi:MAG: hypothetical protein I8H91_02410 [Burkholderiales bacterium]|nr:hypothetical protein [Burkholderiales bacterium]
MKSTNLSNNKHIYDNQINYNKLPSSCLLCSEGALGELGHIIPKFVMRWLKRASKKEEFYLNNTAVKVADTLALKMLCNKCEDIFSEHEKFFTDQYFKRHYRKTPPAEISGDIYFFALSIAWRIMISTPMMQGEENSEKYFRELRDIVKAYLLQPNERAKIDVYVFYANEISANLAAQYYKANLLNFSVRQGIFAHYLIYDDINCCATLSPIPLVYFKLGAYYFIVADQNHLQLLTFPKKIEATEGGKVHILRYSEGLIGFLNHISNGDFDEVDKSIIPLNIKYDRISLKNPHET